MKMMSVRKLRATFGQVWEDLREEGEVVITSNGKPVGVLTPATEDNIEDVLRANRRARAMLAVSRMQQRSAADGLDALSDKDINEEIAAARKKRRKRK